MRRKRQLGFGLGLGGGGSDTLVTLAIIGILGGVAYYSFQDYQARARVSAGLASVDGAKAAMEKAFAKGPADMSLPATTNWMPPRDVQHVEAIGIGRDGTITLLFAPSVAPPSENVVQIVPVSDGKPLDLSQAASKGRKLEWQCGGPNGKTTLPEKLRPRHCRP